MAADTSLIGVMDSFGGKDLTGMTTKAVLVCRLDPCMRFMALIAIQARHGNFGGKGSPRRVAVTGEATRPIGNETTRGLRRERVAGHTGSLLHPDTMNLPVMVTA